jgi:hypothetical protein
MDRKARQYSNAEIRGPELVPNVPGNEQDRARTRGFVIAWAFALIFYFLEYAVRSSPSVMIPQLAAAFRTTAGASVRSLSFITTPTRSRVWSRERLSITWARSGPYP